VVTHIYINDDTSQQMDTMIQTSQDRLKDLFSPFILVALSIVAEKIETSLLVKVQRGKIRYPGRKARLRMIFMMVTAGVSTSYGHDP
jgi:hypothetical protein